MTDIIVELPVVVVSFVGVYALHSLKRQTIYTKQL